MESFERNLVSLFQAIDVCLERRLILSALVLIYLGIDFPHPVAPTHLIHHAIIRTIKRSSTRSNGSTHTDLGSYGYRHYCFIGASTVRRNARLTSPESTPDRAAVSSGGSAANADPG